MGQILQIVRIEIRVKKIKPVFIVNLHIAYSNFVVLISVILDSFKYIPQSSWNYTSLVIRSFSTCDCEGFTRTCLSICKDRSIITFKRWVNNILSYSFKNLLLWGISVHYWLKMVINIKTTRIIDYIPLHILFKFEGYFMIVRIHLKPLKNLLRWPYSQVYLNALALHTF